MTNPHPNAAIAGGTTGIGTLVVWILGRAHVDLSAEEGALIAGGATAVLLFVGRNGISGVWNRLVHGQPKPPAP